MDPSGGNRSPYVFLSYASAVKQELDDPAPID
jgi:hypothetical protein